jgi:hypothetical protein
MKPWLLAMLTANRKLVTRTFTSNTTFTTPFGVSNLVSLVGVGGATTTQEVVDVAVHYYASGTGDPGSTVTWGNFSPTHNSNVSAVNAGGTATITYADINAYGDGTGHVNSTSTGTLVNIIAGTSSSVTLGGWSDSGPITSTGESHIRYSQTGDNTTGFGKTFAGDTGSGVATATYNNVAVTENTPYNLVIPTGGSITITYYQ